MAVHRCWPIVPLALALSCSGPMEAELDCTRIGCDDELLVVLASLPPAPFRVEASTGGGPGHVFECEAGRQCSEEISVPFFLPDQVTIDLVVADETWRFEFSPQYEEHRPNGPGCPPSCLRGIVQVPVTEWMAEGSADGPVGIAIEAPGGCTG